MLHPCTRNAGAVALHSVAHPQPLRPVETRKPEQNARENIDALLGAAGWVVQDYRAFNPSAARGIALREVPLKSGRCDYLLLVDRQPVGVIEAKKAGTTLSAVADQSGHYAENLPDFLAALLPAQIAQLPFLYESTGVETLFRDGRDPEPRSRHVFAFHQPGTLAGWLAEPNTLRARLRRLAIDHPLADGANGAARSGLGASPMRSCQTEAITSLEKSFRRAAPRALIQMATGAGKTYTACAFTCRLIRHAGARRVLFLVDRANLGRQATAEFQQFVTPDTGRKFTELYNVQHLTSNQLDSVARVTICTIQRLYAMLRGEEIDEDLDEKSAFELAEALESGSGVSPLKLRKSRDGASTLTVWRKESFDHIVRSPASLEKFREYIRAHNVDDASRLVVSEELRRDAAATLVTAACAPFDNPAFRDALAMAKQEAEQTIDTVTIDTVVAKGFDAAAKAKAAGLVKSFRDFIEAHRAEIAALQILYSRPFSQRLSEPMLKELERKLRDANATWTEENLWHAFAATAPDKVKGRSVVNRFADLVPLVRFALEQQPVLKPFAESVGERFNEWIASKQGGSGVPPLAADKRRDGASTFTPDQLAWLNLIRDHIATTLSIEPDDFDYAPFSQQGGLGKAHQLFGERLAPLLTELNLALVA